MRERVWIRRALGSLALTLALPFAAAGADELVVRSKEHDFEARARCVWPDDLERGWAPVRVELTDTGGAQRLVEMVVEAKSWRGGGHYAREVVQIEPNETRVLEITLPAFDVPSPYVFEFRIDGMEAGDDSLELADDNHSGRDFALSIAPARRADSDVAAMAEELSGGDTNDLRLEAATFEELPRRQEAYSSLDLVLLEGGSSLAPDKLEPLLAWTRLGGTLVLVGADARSSARAVAPEWTDARFQRPLSNQAADFYHLGLGTLVVDRTGQRELGGELAEAVRIALRLKRSYVPGPAGSRSDSLEPEIEGLSELPYAALLVVLGLFVVLVGPVNFGIAKKLGKPALVLVTIPAMALAGSLALVAYGILHHGVGVKTASLSIALLDQRTHHASVVETRQLFAGLSPGPGLRPSAGTSVYPGTVAIDALGRASYRVNLAGERLLGGAFLPTRTPVRQVLLTDVAARGRLAVVRDGDALRVSNALASEIRELVVRAADGTYHGTDSPLAEGAERGLTALNPTLGAARVRALLDGFDGTEAPLASEGGVPPGVYVARVTRSPLTDECGLSPEQVEGEHRIVGILDTNGESAR